MNKNIKIIGNYVLGPLVFLVLLWFIYHQLLRQPDWQYSMDRVFLALKGPQQWRLWLVLALMPVNWGIEARKWQLALHQAGGISFGNAFRAVLTGTTLASFTPNRMGDYLGRILFVKEGRRLESISLTIVCSMAQIMVTLLLGIGGLLYVCDYLTHSASLHQAGGPGLPVSRYWYIIAASVVALLFLSLTIIYFRLSWLLWILRKIPGWKKYGGFLSVLENVDTRLLLGILFLSFGRYLVFLLQYGLVFPVFGVFLGPGRLFAGISVVFLVMAVVPTFTFLAELGVRWGASIEIMRIFSGNTVGIFAASLAIWLINLVIPALIGSLLILRIKLFKNKRAV